MPADREEQAREIFLEAMALDHGRRERFVEQQCGDDAGLRDEVNSLLAHDDAADGFLDQPAVTPAVRSRRIGSYEIHRVIGSGGMGTVYEATQDHPHRPVALKVLSRGVGLPSALKRFMTEAEILGRLRHPNIAQVHDAGMLEEPEGARPYFAMELIRGRGLVEFADGQELGTRERMELVARVCDAVQHAHLHGVIHRDLKPDNILVDDYGEPKILDFGVARATDADIQITTVQTDVGQLIGTVPYMSPEQVAGDPDQLDERSDVYALGVVLYELLSGRLPHQLDNMSIPEAVRVIREEDPVPLSSTDRVFRGDVETIVDKALEPDRDRRYQSPSELAADIRRFLADEPIVARPPSTFYQLRKFARRRKGLVTGVLAVIVTLAAGATVATVIATDRAAVRREADRLTAVEHTRQLINALRWFNSRAWVVDLDENVNRFLASKGVRLRYPSAPESSLDAMLVLLDAAGRNLPPYLADDPLREADVRYELGRTYHTLGSDDAALVHLERAYALTSSTLSIDHDDVIKTRTTLGRLYRRLGRDEDAVGMFEPLLDWVRMNSSESDRRPQIIMQRLGEAHGHLGRTDEAKALIREALDRAERTLGEKGGGTGLRLLAEILVAEGDLAGAEQLLTESVRRQRLAARDLRSVADSIHDLGRVYRLQDRFAEAEPLLLEALDLRRRIRGPQHPATHDSLRELGELYRAWGKPDEAAAFEAQLRSPVR